MLGLVVVDFSVVFGCLEVVGNAVVVGSLKCGESFQLKRNQSLAIIFLSFSIFPKVPTNAFVLFTVFFLCLMSYTWQSSFRCFGRITIPVSCSFALSSRNGTISKGTPLRPAAIILIWICNIRNIGKCNVFQMKQCVVKIQKYKG